MIRMAKSRSALAVSCVEDRFGLPLIDGGRRGRIHRRLQPETRAPREQSFYLLYLIIRWSSTSRQVTHGYLQVYARFVSHELVFSSSHTTNPNPSQFLLAPVPSLPLSCDSQSQRSRPIESSRHARRLNRQRLERRPILTPHLNLVIFSLMRIRVGDQFPVKPGHTETVHLLDVVLHVGDLTGSVETTPFFDDQSFASVLGGGDGVTEVVSIGTGGGIERIRFESIL